MACSLPQTQQQPQQYQSTLYTTFIPFTDYSQWERRPQKPSIALKHSSKNKIKPPNMVGYTDSTKVSRQRHNGSARGSVIVRSRPPGESRELERRLVSGGTRLLTSTRSGRSQEAAKLRFLRVRNSSACVQCVCVCMRASVCVCVRACVCVCVCVILHCLFFNPVASVFQEIIS